MEMKIITWRWLGGVGYHSLLLAKALPEWDFRCEGSAKNSLFTAAFLQMRDRNGI